jgi:hypothetical protein
LIYVAKESYSCHCKSDGKWFWVIRVGLPYFINEVLVIMRQRKFDTERKGGWDGGSSRRGMTCFENEDGLLSQELQVAPSPQSL